MSERERGWKRNEREEEVNQSERGTHFHFACVMCKWTLNGERESEKKKKKKKRTVIENIQ